MKLQYGQVNPVNSSLKNAVHVVIKMIMGMWIHTATMTVTLFPHLRLFWIHAPLLLRGATHVSVIVNEPDYQYMTEQVHQI